MSTKQELAGVTFDNCALEEAFSFVKEYLNNQNLNIVDMIDMRAILSAYDDAEVRACLERADLVLPDTKEVVQEAGILSDAHLEMVEEHQLLLKVLQLALEEHHEVFLLTETVGQLDHFCEYLEEKFEESVPVSGTCALEECGSSMEHVLNEINAVAPHIVIVILNAPLREQVISRIYPMMNAKLLIGIGEDSIRLSGERKTRKFYQRLIEKRLMKHQIQTMEQENTK